MLQQRVISFIDGFNLYHAIDNLHRPELKWLNLNLLSQTFLQLKSEELTKVYYFSAHADHMNEPTQKRQRAYIKALEITHVIPILGHFKRKDRKCPKCRHKWEGHEEKETDVNIALSLLDLAYQNDFDRALIISNDSDLSPAIRMVRKRFPEFAIPKIIKEKL